MYVYVICVIYCKNRKLEVNCAILEFGSSAARLFGALSGHDISPLLPLN